MKMKDSLFLLISNVLGRGCGVGRGSTNADEGFFVSVDFKCIWTGVWGRGRGPLIMMNDSWFLLNSNVLGTGSGAGGRGPSNE